jgi:hypothetical protein
MKLRLQIWNTSQEKKQGCIFIITFKPRSLTLALLFEDKYYIGVTRNMRVTQRINY